MASFITRRHLSRRAAAARGRRGARIAAAGVDDARDERDSEAAGSLSAPSTFPHGAHDGALDAEG